MDRINELERPLKILDVGGTEGFWINMGFCNESGVEITLLNLKTIPVSKSGFKSIAGDARCMCKFADQSFDMIFSNSVIEHVGDQKDQQRMASEMQRVGKHLFLQTPNKHFPIEPHFLFPFFQYLPHGAKTWLLSHFSLGWHPRYHDRASAAAAAHSVRLLSRRELTRLFPHATVTSEKWMGLLKSYLVYQANQA